jgi:hypothetical protein
MDRRRRFGLTVGGILCALALIFFLRHKHHIPYRVCLTAGPTLLVAGLVAPVLLGPVEKVWMALARVLGFINSRILLSVVFFLLVAPVALLLKLLGRDPLARRRDPKASSYWLPHPPAEDPQRYKHPY